VEMLLAVQSHTRIACLVDEPERHLHPQLQRVVARWLQDLVLKRSSQVIVATHSPYFLRGGPKSAFTFLQPTSRGSLAMSFNQRELDAFGLLAEEMGFDRGELLSGLELILFVEGEADRALLTAVPNASTTRASRRTGWSVARSSGPSKRRSSMSSASAASSPSSSVPDRCR
jgi:predicted ATP-dependent endonuclease of OLD family